MAAAPRYGAFAMVIKKPAPGCPGAGLVATMPRRQTTPSVAVAAPSEALIAKSSLMDLAVFAINA